MGMQMKWLSRLRLQSKLIIFIFASILIQIIVLGSLSINIISDVLEKQIGERALTVSKVFSQNEKLQKLMYMDDPNGKIQEMAEKIRKEIGAEFVVVGDENIKRFAHPDEWKIGKHMVGGDSMRAINTGESYISRAVGTLGPSIRGKVPVYYNGEIVGLISTGYLINDVRDIISEYVISFKIVLFILLLIGVISAVLIARGLKNAIFGLEPHEIASMLSERNTIIESIHEGILAIDNEKNIRFANGAALSILERDRTDSVVGEGINKIFPKFNLGNVLEKGRSILNYEIFMKRNLIANVNPILHNKNIMGAVISFRPKDELYELGKKLSYVRQYTETLRAKTHDYSNKLHTIAGLIQTDNYDEALKFVLQEYSDYSEILEIVNSTIKDSIIASLILGKFNYAEEHKVSLEIDENSLLNEVPPNIDSYKLVDILGNTLDNAIEAASSSSDKKVIISFTDLGDDVVFDIEDSGKGIKDDLYNSIFEKGYSTKGNYGRGLGLHIVKRRLNDMGGQISCSRSDLGGAAFTIIIPKKL